MYVVHMHITPYGERIKEVWLEALLIEGVIGKNLEVIIATIPS